MPWNRTNGVARRPSRPRSSQPLNGRHVPRQIEQIAVGIVGEELRLIVVGRVEDVASVGFALVELVVRVVIHALFDHLGIAGRIVDIDNVLGGHFVDRLADADARVVVLVFGRRLTADSVGRRVDHDLPQTALEVVLVRGRADLRARAGVDVIFFPFSLDSLFGAVAGVA
jgi:hypothetical protein